MWATTTNVGSSMKSSASIAFALSLYSRSRFPQHSRLCSAEGKTLFFAQPSLIWSASLCFQLKKIAPDYYDNLPCHTSWIRVLIDFIRDPELGPKSRIRRSIRSDALKMNNAINLKNKSKVNEVLHDVVDNNNNTHHQHQPSLSKEERKLINKLKHSGKGNESPSIGITNGDHSKTEW